MPRLPVFWVFLSRAQSPSPAPPRRAVKRHRFAVEDGIAAIAGAGRVLFCVVVLFFAVPTFYKLGYNLTVPPRELQKFLDKYNEHVDLSPEGNLVFLAFVVAVVGFFCVVAIWDICRTWRDGDTPPFLIGLVMLLPGAGLGYLGYMGLKLNPPASVIEPAQIIYMAAFGTIVGLIGLVLMINGRQR